MAQFSDFLESLQDGAANLIEKVDAKDDKSHAERALLKVMNRPKTGLTINWSNKYNNHHGTLTIDSSYTDSSSLQCWKYRRTLLTETRTNQYGGSICDTAEQDEFGVATPKAWRIVREIELLSTPKSKEQNAGLRPQKSKPVPDATVREAQELLSRLGYNPGPIDGLMGSKTRNAIIEFQSSKNISADGKATVDLLAHMKDVVEEMPSTGNNVEIANDGHHEKPTPEHIRSERNTTTLNADSSSTDRTEDTKAPPLDTGLETGKTGQKKREVDKRNLYPVHDNTADDEQMRKAMAAANRDDFSLASPILLSLAQQGNIDAQYYIGWLYENRWRLSKSDIGLKGNNQEAAKWYSEAASSGDVLAKKALERMMHSDAKIRKQYSTILD